MSLKNILFSSAALMAVSADALAQQPEEPNFLVSMAPLVIIFIIFYFMLIRPQQKRAKEHKEMTEALAKGDEIVTQGGILGKVTKVGENFAEVEISDGVAVKIQRQQVGAVMPKGTIKSA